MPSFEQSTNASISNLNACVRDLMDVAHHLMDMAIEQERKIEKLEKELKYLRSATAMIAVNI